MAVADGELEDLARRLVAPLRTGDVVEGATLVAITGELALQYDFVHGDARARIEVVPLPGPSPGSAAAVPRRKPAGPAGHPTLIATVQTFIAWIPSPVRAAASAGTSRSRWPRLASVRAR